MSRRSARKSRNQLMGGHQRCWVWGRHAVREILQAGRWPVMELVLADSLPDDLSEEFHTLADSHADSCSVEPAKRLSQLCGVKNHQGVIAKMPPFPYDVADEVLQSAPDQPLFVLLDCIQDSYNFGAILRSAEVLGVDGVFIGETHQAEVNSLVARTSGGAVNYLKIAQVSDLTAWARSLRERGHHLVAASEKATRSPSQWDFRPATTLIIGNEGEGIGPQLLELCDGSIAIPQCGQVGSLNAAVAAGILLYEARRQRNE